MKRLFSICILLLISLTGCVKETPSQPKMTQSVMIESEAVKATTPTSAPAPTPTEESTAPPSDALTAYCKIKANMELIQLKKHQLEADYRIGAVTETAFLSEKEEFRQQSNALDQEKDQLDDQIKAEERYLQAYQGQSMDFLLQQLYEAKAQEDQWELEGEQLNETYLRGDVSEDLFLQQRFQLFLKEEQADLKADLLEDLLEDLGWDD